MGPDPYRDWLEIKTDNETPNYYELLGLAAFSSDPAAIHKAYADRYALVRRYEAGNFGEQALAIMAELSDAFKCLTNELQKSQYDDELRQALGARSTESIGGASHETSIDTPQYLPPEVVQEALTESADDNVGWPLEAAADPLEPDDAPQPATPLSGVAAFAPSQPKDSALREPMSPSGFTQVNGDGSDQRPEPVHSDPKQASRASRETAPHPMMVAIIEVDNWLEELAGPSNRGVHIAFRACAITLPSVFMLLIALLAWNWLSPSAEVVDKTVATSPDGNEMIADSKTDEKASAENQSGDEPDGAEKQPDEPVAASVENSVERILEEPDPRPSGDDVIPRWERWEIRFDSSSVTEYASQLDAFKIELGAAGGGTKDVDYAFNFTEGKPDTRSGPGDKEQRLYMTWRGGNFREFDEQLLSAAGVPIKNRVLMQFYPEDVENHLAWIEREYGDKQNKKTQEYLKTVFEPKPKGDIWEFVVAEMRFRDSPEVEPVESSSGSMADTNLSDDRGDGSPAVSFANTVFADAFITSDNADRLTHLATLTGHEDPVVSIAFSPDGSTLASGSYDHTIKLWDIATRQQRATLSAHLSSVYTVAFSPDGKFLASGSLDKTIRIWDIETGQVRIAVAGHRNLVMSVAFSPDGRWLASGSSDSTINFWVSSIGKLVASASGHRRGTHCIVFSPDGATLVSGGADRSVAMWTPGTGIQRARVGVRQIVHALAYSPDGRTLAAGLHDGAIRLWAGEQERTLTTQDEVTSLAFSADGKMLVVGGGRTIKLWDVETENELATLSGHGHIVRSVAFSPDGRLLASSSSDKTIKLWSVPGSRSLTMTNSIGMQLALIPAGEFLMGSPDSDPYARAEEMPQHLVRITKPFYLQTTEVTQGQWEAVMETTPWTEERYVQLGADYPASCISWDDAAEFCRRLSTREGREYRLPTAAEWEYACRAGTTTRYSFGDNLLELFNYAWFEDNGYRSDEKYAHLVGMKRPNAWGLYDMHGNLFEWCSDWYDASYYNKSPESDPQGPDTGTKRVTRGGGWLNSAGDERSAFCLPLPPDNRDIAFGFRLAMTAPDTPAAGVPMADDGSSILPASIGSTRFWGLKAGSLVGQDWVLRDTLIRSDSKGDTYKELQGSIEASCDLLSTSLRKSASELGLPVNYWDSVLTLPADTAFHEFTAEATKIGEKLKTDVSDAAFMSYTIGYNLYLCISSLERIGELYDDGNPFAAVEAKTDVLTALRKLNAQARFAAFPDDMVTFLAAIETQAENISDRNSAADCVERMRLKFPSLTGEPGYVGEPGSVSGNPVAGSRPQPQASKASGIVTYQQFKRSYRPHDELLNPDSAQTKITAAMVEQNVETAAVVMEALVKQDDGEGLLAFAATIPSIPRTKAGAVLDLMRDDLAVKGLNSLTDKWSLDLLYYVSEETFNRLSDRLNSLKAYRK